MLSDSPDPKRVLNSSKEQREQQEGRRERKKRELRRRIRRAAAALFAEKGYEETTVDEIAERADVAKGTFFNYFPRKDALLAELAAELAEDLEEALGPPESWQGSKREQLLRFFSALGERVHQDPKLFKVMVVENLRNFWMRGEEETERQLRHLMRTLLTEAVSDGEFPPDTDVDAGTKLIEAVYATTVIESLRQGTAAEYRKDLTTRMNIIYRGLGGESVCVEGSGG